MNSREYDEFIDRVYQKKEKRSTSSRAKATAKRIDAIRNLKLNANG